MLAARVLRVGLGDCEGGGGWAAGSAGKVNGAGRGGRGRKSIEVSLYRRRQLCVKCLPEQREHGDSSGCLQSCDGWDWRHLEHFLCSRGRWQSGERWFLEWQRVQNRTAVLGLRLAAVRV
jgi:hypothetical protein